MEETGTERWKPSTQRIWNLNAKVRANWAASPGKGCGKGKIVERVINSEKDW